MTKTSSPVLGLIGLLLLTAACSAGPIVAGTPAAGAGPATTGGAADAGLSSVVFIGDSIAVGEALPLARAFAAGDVQFRSLASEGGGNVVGPFSEENWRTLPEQISSARPSAVVYQISTFDWGNEQEQRAAYDRLLTTVSDAGAKLVFVTAPPIRPDGFYAPHMADLERAPAAARAVAEGASGRAVVLDASAVWGDTYQQFRDGTADRSPDGIHTCPQGAARFANWLLGELAALFPGFTPADPHVWANTGWSADKHFTGC